MSLICWQQIKKTKKTPALGPGLKENETTGGVAPPGWAWYHMTRQNRTPNLPFSMRST